MITVFSLKESMRELYDCFVSSSEYSSVYQSYVWGELKRYDGWEVSRIVAMENERVVGTLSCLKKNLPGLFKKIFYVPRGPIVEYQSATSGDVVSILFQYLKEQAFREHALFIRINPGLQKEYFDETYFVRQGFSKVTNPILHTATFQLDLTKNEEELFNSMEPRVRYDIRRATRDGVIIKESDDSDESLEKFYFLLKEVSVRNEFPIYSLTMMKNIWKTLYPLNMCKIFFAQHNENIIAGAFLLLFGKKCIYQWGGAQKVSVNPNQLMHWEIIRWAKARGCFVYDFQGVPDGITEQDPLWGIFLFKRGFGGKYIKLIDEYDFVLSPLGYKLYQRFESYYLKPDTLIRKWLKK